MVSYGKVMMVHIAAIFLFTVMSAQAENQLNRSLSNEMELFSNAVRGWVQELSRDNEASIYSGSCGFWYITYNHTLLLTPIGNHLTEEIRNLLQAHPELREFEKEWIFVSVIDYYSEEDLVSAIDMTTVRVRGFEINYYPTFVHPCLKGK